MWDWRYPIGDIRKEIRAARSKGDSHISLDSIDNLLDDLTSIYNRLEAEDATSPEREADQLKKFVEDQKSVISTSYEHGKQYANIVIFGGYAGLFAVWNFTKNSLENWQVLLIGLFTLISLLSYVSFEIYASYPFTGYF